MSEVSCDIAHAFSRPDAEENQVNAVCLFLSGEQPASLLVASAHDDGTVAIWDVCSRKLATVIPAHSSRATALAVLPATTEAEGASGALTLLSAGHDGALRLWRQGLPQESEDAAAAAWRCEGGFFALDRLACVAAHRSGLAVAGDLNGNSAVGSARGGRVYIIALPVGGA